MNFSRMSSSEPDAIHEMNGIEKTFQATLGVTGSSFSKSGKNETCDKEVRKACEKAFATLKDNRYKNSFVFQVTNVQTEEVVFNAVFQANDENFVF